MISMNVRDVMVARPVTIDPNAVIVDAAKRMQDHKIGSVIVVENQRVLGIVTERDLVRRVIADNRDPQTTLIHAVMSAPVCSISPDEDIVNAAHIMRQKGIRRIVVMDEEELVGILTTNDLVRNMKRHIEEVASMLYLVGRTWM